MHDRLKVTTVVGTRPELIRLSRIIARLDTCTNHTLIHTGQNYDYELNQVFFDELEIRKPDYYLDADKEPVEKTIADILQKIAVVFAEIEPDAVLILGDTNSSLSAIIAKKMKIPIFHMEAGNRCFDQRVPEETNRRIVDAISDINLPYSDIAREYLLREGFPPDRIIKTGSPMREVIEYYSSGIEKSDIHQRLNLEKGCYFVVSSHREENVDNTENIKKLVGILNTLAEKYNQPIIFSTHPRTRNRLENLDITLDNRVKMLKPMGFFDYIKLQKHAHAVLSDSGTITEEASIIGFSALNLREAHERPEGMEEAVVMMTGYNIDRVLQGIYVIDDSSTSYTPEPVKDYQVANVSEKILRIILSYTDYVNRVVWSKPI
ncbi:MAG TPA: UDP-N-acetylglucosamine 2-epimerase (non-hydrolyzing) [Gammaproteobacteria bacterium]|nr:UDP-N-acetylglucosamine 2-epimerase (non-hydrolyzing) [Gammaproteobacteria bacterium]